jgi:hypothetical protein
MMVDAQGEVYVISNAMPGGLFIHIPSTAWGASSPQTVDSNFRYPTSGVAGDIRNSEMLIDTGSDVYYWSVDDGNFPRAMETPGIWLYQSDPSKLSKSICWSSDGGKYYTIPIEIIETLPFPTLQMTVFVYTRQN